MRKTIVVLFALVCMVSVAMAEQGVGIGGSFQDGFFGPLLKYDWMFSKYFGIECRVSYLTGSEEVDVVAVEKLYQAGTFRGTATITNAGIDVDTDVIPLELALKLVYPNEKWALYMLVGGGYYIYDGEIMKIGGPDASPEDAPGFFGALGCEFRVNGNMVLFADIKYTKATWESEEDYSGSRRQYRGFFSYADFDYEGTQTVEGGLDGVGGTIGLIWKF